MDIYVVSNQPSRRTDYFIRAGESVGQTVRFITYDELLTILNQPEGQIIKLEPPIYQETSVLAWHRLCEEYMSLLQEIANRCSQEVFFLNRPEAILRSLDKVTTKRTLQDLSVTPVLLEKVESFDHLHSLVSERNSSSLFLKPRFGSGAGGVMAIRRHPVKDQWTVYAPLSDSAGILSNIKHIRKITRVEEIRRLVDTICQCGAMAEQWIPKERLEGEHYDLRVVCRSGKVEHIVVRCSNGPITNLHLNNNAKSFATLPLTEDVRQTIYRDSTQAVTQTGLRYGGVDLLIGQGSGQPYIIEVNGQGDHIYDDLFRENNIYKNQIREWLS